MPRPPPSHYPQRRSRKRLFVALLMVCALAALAVAWTLTPLARLLDPRMLAAYEQQVRASSLAPLMVIPAIVIGGLLAAPGTLLIGATVLLFGSWPGAAYAYVGMLVNGVVIYLIGRFGARAPVEDWLARHAGSRLVAFNGLLARRGLYAVTLIRLTPIPYTLQSVVAGASRIGFADYVLGTAIGIVPIVALLAGLASQLDAWLANPAWSRLLALVGTAVVVIAIAWVLKRWVTRSARS